MFRQMLKAVGAVLGLRQAQNQDAAESLAQLKELESSRPAGHVLLNRKQARYMVRCQRRGGKLTGHTRRGVRPGRHWSACR